MKLNTKQQRALIADFKKTVSDYYGERLAKIILYGSYARGDFHEESDIDFLVVLKDGEIRKFRETIQMSEVVHPLMFKHDITISYHPYSLGKYLSEESPFLFWIRKQGIEVWTTT